LGYVQTSTHHYHIYDKSFSKDEPLIIKDVLGKTE